MKPISATTTVDRPREEVFDLIADLRAHEQWTDHFLVDWSGDARKVRVRSALPGPKDWSDVEVLELERPARTFERTTGRGGKRVTGGEYRLEDAGAGRTDVTFTFSYERAPLSERVLAPMLSGWLRKQNQRAMDRLKEVAEARAATAAGAARAA